LKKSSENLIENHLMQQFVDGIVRRFARRIARIDPK
jgi:hypothetical protein